MTHKKKSSAKRSRLDENHFRGLLLSVTIDVIFFWIAISKKRLLIKRFFGQVTFFAYFLSNSFFLSSLCSSIHSRECRRRKPFYCSFLPRFFTQDIFYVIINFVWLDQNHPFLCKTSKHSNQQGRFSFVSLEKHFLQNQHILLSSGQKIKRGLFISSLLPLLLNEKHLILNLVNAYFYIWNLESGNLVLERKKDSLDEIF